MPPQGTIEPIPNRTSESGINPPSKTEFSENIPNPNLTTEHNELSNQTGEMTTATSQETESAKLSDHKAPVVGPEVGVEPVEKVQTENTAPAIPHSHTKEEVIKMANTLMSHGKNVGDDASAIEDAFNRLNSGFTGAEDDH